MLDKYEENQVETTQYNTEMNYAQDVLGHMPLSNTNTKMTDCDE